MEGEGEPPPHCFDLFLALFALGNLDIFFGSSWCSVSGCCLTSPGLLDYWEMTSSMFPYSTLSLVRFWMHAHASVYASIGTAPCIWQSLVRRCLCLKSTVSPFFWEMAVFTASWFDSGYMYCQSTKAWIFTYFFVGLLGSCGRFSSCSAWLCRGPEADSHGLAVQQTMIIPQLHFVARWFMSLLCRSSRFFVPVCVKTVETSHSCLDKFVVIPVVTQMQIPLVLTTI